jgi:hypothetical protein
VYKSLTELLHDYWRNRAKGMGDELKRRVNIIIHDLVTNEMIPELMVLYSNLRKGQSVLLVTYLRNILRKVEPKYRAQVQTIWAELETSISEALETKDRNFMSDTIYSDVQKSLGGPTWQSIEKVTTNRQFWNKKAAKKFHLKSTPLCHTASLTSVIKFLIHSAIIKTGGSCDKRFRFKLALDGRPLAGGQVGLMLVPLDNDLFPPQDPRSCIYIALWPGKESHDNVIKNCSVIKSELNKLKQSGVVVNHQTYETNFIWVSDWKAWKETMTMPSDEFCPYCLIKKCDLIFTGDRSIERQTTPNFFGFTAHDTGLCSLHAAQRLTENQLSTMFKIRSSEGTMSKDDFEQTIRKILPRFHLVNKDKDSEEDNEWKDFKVCFNNI